MFRSLRRLCSVASSSAMSRSRLLRLRCALEDVLAVYVAQLYLRDVLGLGLVDAEAGHEVRHDVGLALRVADDVDGLVYVEQYPAEALEEVQLLLLAAEVEVDAPLHAVEPPGRPLCEYLAHAHDLRRARDEDVEVAGEGVHQRRGLEELCHELFRVGAALEVDGELQAAEVGLVAHVGDLLDLARLDQLRDLVHDGLGRGGVGYLVDLYDVLLGVIPPAGADLEAAAAGAVYLLHDAGLHDYLAARGEVRGGQGRHEVALRVRGCSLSPSRRPR